MAGGSEIAAVFRGLAEDAAQAGENVEKAMSRFFEDTAEKEDASVATHMAAEEENTRAANAIRPPEENLPSAGGAGETAGSSGVTGRNPLARMLNGESPGETGHSATFGHTDSFDYKKTFFDEHPDLEGKVVVHHAVEQQTLRRYPGKVTPNEMHSLENLRGIPKGDVNNRVHLSQLRKEWNRFYRDNPNPSKQDLLDHATKLDMKYGSEFDPPIK